MTDAKKLPEPEFTPPPPRFIVPLIATTVAFIIIGIILLIAGKFIFAGILALFAAAMGVGSQVSKSNKL